jgi:hypothetical protein
MAEGEAAVTEHTQSHVRAAESKDLPQLCAECLEHIRFGELVAEHINHLAHFRCEIRAANQRRARP